MTVPAPGPHGGDGARLAAALGVAPTDVLDLSASLNPAAPPVARIVGRHLGALSRYPDPAVATAALAAALGVGEERVMLTNGGAEAIALVAAELGGGPVAEPDFGLYPRQADGPRWRSDPHNPYGRLAGPEERAGVWDEAFYPLATGRWTAGRPGSVVVGSLTKVFGAPGLRAGYVVVPEAGEVPAGPEAGATPAAGLADSLRRRQPRWSVNGLVASALPELLAGADLAAWAAEVAAGRAELVALLTEHGLAAEPSDANFVLVRAPGLRGRLAPHGVLVRDCASFGLPDHARIAVPPRASLGRLAEALTASRATGGPAGQVGARPLTARRPGPWPEPRPRGGALMVCGTASHVGKTWTVAGLCRALARQGVSVAPFKAQNMALNSGVTPSGHEISRAQMVQALAAGVEPEVAMNPVLLKPTSERGSQVVLMGRPWRHLDAAAYQAAKPELMGTVLGCLDDLRRRFDVVVIEGAGSPAEINLLDHDLVNLGLAARAGVPALLVGDIDRGGVFAALYGTMAVLPPDLARLVRGFVINKFRGDPALLGGALADLEGRTGVPVLGVVPWLGALSLDAEDSLSLPPPTGVATAAAGVDVAVVRFPRLSNFTDLDPLALEPDVSVRLVDCPSALGRPDLVVLPGTKSTVADLDWLRASGLAGALAAAREAGAAVLGVCGGYQMLGRTIHDDVEWGRGRVEALGWLAADTTFGPEKVVRQRSGQALGEVVSGYQLHHGRVAGADPWVELDGGQPEGSVDAAGRVWGTTLHGLFERDGFRSAFLSRVAPRFRPSGLSFAAARQAQVDRVADALEAHLDLAAVQSIIKEGAVVGVTGRGGRSRAGPPVRSWERMHR